MKVNVQVMKNNLSKIEKAINNPRLVLNKLKISDIIDYLSTPVMKSIFEARYGDGVDVMSRDWDNLIIIDACRYDTFEKFGSIEGDLNSIVSRGSGSDEYIENNFMGRQFYDTVYVTANAKSYTHLHDSNVFHNIYYTFDSEINATNENWLQSIRPEVVRDAAISEVNKKPNKRFIIHFMQPHPPFLGQKATRLREHVRNHNVRFEQWDNVNTKSSQTDVIRNLVTAASHGYISNEDLYTVYVENLHIVLEKVKDIINEVEGKSVVTSDHGELLGLSNNLSSQKFGHGREIYTKDLRIVPWFEPKFGNRREITVDPPKNSQSPIDDNAVHEQLRALGYN